MAAVFRGLQVRLGPGRAGAHVDDVRECGPALAEATAADGPNSSSAAASQHPVFFAPTLIMADFASPVYSEAKQQQLRVASELWRVRRQIRALEFAAHEQERELLQQQQVQHRNNVLAGHSARFWTLVAPPELPGMVLPPEWEQEGVLRDMAAAAALAALRATAPPAALPWPPPAGPGSADDETLWREVGTPLHSEPCARGASSDRTGAAGAANPRTEPPESASWRCWLLVLHHAPSGRMVAVVAALRKLLPPQAPNVQRIAFVALGRADGRDRAVAEGESTLAHLPPPPAPRQIDQLGARLVDAVRSALDGWRPDAATPPQPRRALVAQNEELTLAPEIARRLLPLRPSCYPLLAQACDAVVEIAQAAREVDCTGTRARVVSARERLVEALRRAAALRPRHAACWRHRLSSRLAIELSVRAELQRAADLMPPQAASGGRAAALREAALAVIEGFGAPDERRANAVELAAVDAFMDMKPSAGVARLRAAALEVMSFFGRDGRRAKASELLVIEAFEEAQRRGKPAELALIHAAEVTGVTDVVRDSPDRIVETGAPGDVAQVGEELRCDEQQDASHSEAPQPALEPQGGAGVRTLVLLHAHPGTCGAARRALGDLLDYLLHLTPIDSLRTDTENEGQGHFDAGGTPLAFASDAPDAQNTAGAGARDGAGTAAADDELRRTIGGQVMDVDACLQPLGGGAGLCAHVDLIACVHETAGAATCIEPLPEQEAAAADLVHAAERGTSSAADPFTMEYACGGIVGYACNLDVLSLVLREGYVQRRLGGAMYARLLLALLDGHARVHDRRLPAFLIRLLAESAWNCIRAARVRNGARIGFDSNLDEAEQRMSMLGPAALASLRMELADVAGCGSPTRL